MTRTLFMLIVLLLASAGIAAYTLHLQARASGAPPLTITRITLVANNLPAMLKFYNTVFETKLEPTAAFGAGAPALYQGRLAGVNLLLCPNEIAKVKAEQNRHQLRLSVSDLAETLKRVRNAGGTVDGQITEAAGERLVAVRDPDGNTIELTQPIR
jgi:predicted enzyme related to lactoylglutathione lyase